MPGKLIPGDKKTPIYKKSSSFKMKKSPAKATTGQHHRNVIDRKSPRAKAKR